jgi:hypothetical protein
MVYSGRIRILVFTAALVLVLYHLGFPELESSMSHLDCLVTRTTFDLLRRRNPPAFLLSILFEKSVAVVLHLFFSQLHLKTSPPIMCMGDPPISKVHCDLYWNFAQCKAGNSRAYLMRELSARKSNLNSVTLDCCYIWLLT